MFPGTFGWLPLGTLGLRRLTAPSPLLAKALAAEVAIDMACQANWLSIILEGDSKAVLNSLSTKNSSSVWSISVVLVNCFCKLAAIPVCHAGFVPRALNFLAHSIAR